MQYLKLSFHLKLLQNITFIVYTVQYILKLTHESLYPPLPHLNTTLIPPPFCNHQFVLYICEFVSFLLYSPVVFFRFHI